MENEKARSKPRRARLASVNLPSGGLSGSLTALHPRSRPSRQAPNMTAVRRSAVIHGSSQSKMPPIVDPRLGILRIAGGQLAGRQAQHHQRETIEDEVDGHE